MAYLCKIGNCRGGHWPSALKDGRTILAPAITFVSFHKKLIILWQSVDCCFVYIVPFFVRLGSTISLCGAAFAKALFRVGFDYSQPSRRLPISWV